MTNYENFSRGFERGYSLIPSRDLLRARAEILQALKITDHVNFTLYLSGAQQMTPDQAAAVGRVFLNYGILNPWGNEKGI